MSIKNQQFQRKTRKSFSQKDDQNIFESENKNQKRFSELQKNKIIPEFYNSLDKTKLKSRSSLPTEFHRDKLSYNKMNNLDENNLSKGSSNSKDVNSSLEKMSSKNVIKNKLMFDSFQGGIKDIKVVWKNKAQDKDKEEEKDPLDKQYENIENFLMHLTEKCKVSENFEVNYSSSTLGFTGSKKSFSKSDDKNTKINLKNIIHNNKNENKKIAPCVILSDIYHVEQKENKLDILVQTMDEYKDIIIEKMLCKNFKDRLLLNIFICLSQLSFKLYNCVENKTKYENIRKYISSVTDEIKYNLINNPNFTLNLINQKFIDIDNIDKNLLINNDFEIKDNDNDNNPININSSMNFVTKTNKNMNTSTSSKSEDINKNKENFTNFFNEDIIYENFEEFNIDNKNDKDIYVNSNLFYEMDKMETKSNVNNNAPEKNPMLNKQNIMDNNAFPQRSQRSKIRRNATNRLILKQRPTRLYTNTNQLPHFVNSNNYDFHIININGDDDIEDSSDDSIYSDEECVEVTEAYKFEKQKLLFFDDYVKDKDKRRLTKIDSIEIKPDARFVKNKARITELNEISYKNIIDIIHDDPSILPNHQLNMNPRDIAEFIRQKEELLKSDEESKEEEKDEIENNRKSSSNDSSLAGNQMKELKRFKNINNQIIKANEEEEDEENENDDNNNDNNNINNESWSSSNSEGKNENKNIKIFHFDNDTNTEN